MPDGGYQDFVSNFDSQENSFIKLPATSRQEKKRGA
jgi:hypothetical protein